MTFLCVFRMAFVAPMMLMCHVEFYLSDMLMLMPVALFDFSFAKLAQAASCKYLCIITAENSDTLS